ncbi:hypothetical protein AAF712_004157 [Marasmius tenuissimus]|uniref:Uncharacterized protein n=1 Tax=Marasmius tenuissimus TaxID=585030 RepID=A0ABR3A605_9AGAR
MVDQDTDRWIFEVLAPEIRRKMEDQENKVQWTDLVAQSLREGHGKGIKREDIEGALRSIPYHPAMRRAVSNLKAGGRTTFLCLSNANSVFIDVILKEKELETLFDEIITNPAQWEESGLLNLRRRVDPEGPQHHCEVGCSANMCKGGQIFTPVPSQITDERLRRSRTSRIPREAHTRVRPYRLCWRWFQRLLPRSPPKKVRSLSLSSSKDTD